MHPNTANNIYPVASPLERAAERLIQAKAAEQAAQHLRLVAELEVLDLLGEINGEGTTHVEDGNYKITVRCAMNRAIDRDVLCQIANDIPEPIAKRLFRWKPELDLKELRYIQSNEPQLYGIVAQAITMKSAKPAISVERIEG